MIATSDICNDNVHNFKFDNTQTIHSNSKANNTGLVMLDANCTCCEWVRERNQIVC